VSRALLHVGVIGPDVKTWQEHLGKMSKPTTWITARGIKRSWPDAWRWPLESDGNFGERTEAATQAWQYMNALKVDGAVGPVTWRSAGLLLAPGLIEVIKGTDLSAIQGVRPITEWSQMATMGIRFAIMRAVVGNESWSDTAALENVRRARAHGIVCGPYVFPYPLPHINPIDQAEHFVRRLEAMKVDLSELPIAFDAEWPPREEYKTINGVKQLMYPWKKWGCSAPQIRQWIMQCISRLERLIGRHVIVYSYRYWLKCIEAELIPELAERPLWLADYTYMGRWPSREECARVKAPAPWKQIAIMQHDGNGGLRLPSGGDADFNVMFGGEATLEKIVRDRLATPTDTLPDLKPAAPEPFIDLAAAKHEQLGILTEEGIRAYRQSRIDIAA
jgi:GH25 family lysozyme M1 (1,4-beta-N-acetylmuramidase)